MTELSGVICLGPVLKHQIAAVAQLEATAFPPPVYPVFFFRQAYDLWPELFWVARRDEQILAYLLCAAEYADPARLSLMSFAVAPQAQGQGVGKALLRSFFDALPAIAPTVRQIWLTADPANEAAIRLYQQHGFRQSGEEIDYYGAGYRRLVMTAEIAAK